MRQGNESATDFRHRRHIRQLLVALAISTAFAPGLLAESEAQKRWLRLETENFTLFSNGAEGSARSTAYDLEALNRVVSQLWPGIETDSTKPTYLYLFDSETSFRPYRLAPADNVSGPRKIEAAGPSPGYLVPHEHGNYGALFLDSEARPVRFVYKQYIHQLLHDTVPGLPLWLQHGLAEYYSTFKIEDGYASIGLAIPRHLRFVASPRSWELMSLATVLERDEFLGNAGDASPFLSISWGLVHYLLTADQDLHRRVPDYIRTVLAGSPGRQAFDEIFGVDPVTLQTKLGEHARAREFRYTRLVVDPGAHPIRVREMAGHETLYRLGDLLAHNGSDRHAEAAVLFESALGLKPDHGPSRAGLGWLAELSEDEAGAIQNYRKAAESLPDDALVQYLFGASLVRSMNNQRPETAEQQAELAAAIAALGHATELRPDFADAWANLGFARNLDPAASQEAVKALEKAAELLPGRHDILFNLLLAHARVGQRPGADDAVEQLRHSGADATTLARAQEVLLQMDYRDANLLVRKGRLDDAIAIFARIQAESTNPALQQQAAARLVDLEPVAQHNRFGVLYQQAIDLLRAGQNDDAAAAVEDLRKIAKPGLQTKACEDLGEIIASRSAG